MRGFAAGACFILVHTRGHFQVCPICPRIWLPNINLVYYNGALNCRVKYDKLYWSWNCWHTLRSSIPQVETRKFLKRKSPSENKPLVSQITPVRVNFWERTHSLDIHWSLALIGDVTGTGSRTLETGTELTSISTVQFRELPFFPTSKNLTNWRPYSPNWTVHWRTKPSTHLSEFFGLISTAAYLKRLQF